MLRTYISQEELNNYIENMIDGTLFRENNFVNMIL